MNMLFPSTKQRPDPSRSQTAPRPLYGPALELNLCPNSCAPSQRNIAAGFFSGGNCDDPAAHKAVSLANFAKQLANI
ncbi:MAG: hypothetical protein PWQ55_1952 [Chloroflexota bacterium]|nr:hypothetical protein [Chloroflexota bacterium]